MKKLILCSILFISTLGFSQDVITLNDGRTVSAKILELTPDLVKYKKMDNLEGPTYTVPVSDLVKIRYANGSEDTFNASGSASKSEASPSKSEEENTPSIFKGKFDVNDNETASYIEAIVKNAGAKLLERCVGRADNQSTEIFFADVFRDDVAMELHIPFQVKWDKGLANKERWIRGEVIVNRDGKRQWKYQSDSGLMFKGCAKGIMDL